MSRCSRSHGLRGCLAVAPARSAGTGFGAWRFTPLPGATSMTVWRAESAGLVDASPAATCYHRHSHIHPDREKDRAGNKEAPEPVSCAVHNVGEPGGVGRGSKQQDQRRFGRVHRAILAESHSAAHRSFARRQPAYPGCKKTPSPNESSPAGRPRVAAYAVSPAKMLLRMIA